MHCVPAGSGFQTSLLTVARQFMSQLQREMLTQQGVVWSCVAAVGLAEREDAIRQCRCSLGEQAKQGEDEEHNRSVVLHGDALGALDRGGEQLS
jgi:hypothetical protein